jgi:flagellar biosynthetic protein FliO
MELIRQLLAVTFVLALAVAAVWWLRRANPVRFGSRGSERGRRQLEMVERLPLGPQHSLCLVRCGDKALVVGLHAGGCTLLESRPWEELEAGRAEPLSKAMRA